MQTLMAEADQTPQFGMDFTTIPTATTPTKMTEKPTANERCVSHYQFSLSPL